MSVENIVRRLYTAQTRTHAQYWDLAEWFNAQALAKVPQRETAGLIASMFQRLAPKGKPVIRLSQSAISQMLNGYRRWHDVPEAREYHPGTLYQVLGKSGELADFESIMADRAQRRSKRAMKDGGKTASEKTEKSVKDMSEDGRHNYSVEDEAWDDAVALLKQFAASLDLDPAEVLISLVVRAEAELD